MTLISNTDYLAVDEDAIPGRCSNQWVLHDETQWRSPAYLMNWMQQRQENTVIAKEVLNHRFRNMMSDEDEDGGMYEIHQSGSRFEGQRGERR